jgi:hypothetical protein
MLPMPTIPNLTPLKDNASSSPIFQRYLLKAPILLPSLTHSIASGRRQRFHHNDLIAGFI